MTHLRVERINDHGRHPNKLISFIKEDRRTTTEVEQQQALGVLNRVAAIVYPIMKDNGLQITTLEEHPFNDSYAGINYDAGDCIGLVLRTAHGGWVPEVFVLSVMLHELSHCTNMHHAAPFWKTLGLYRTHMAQLRAKNYTGEGFWRNGIVLGSGDSTSLATTEADMPKSLCGGAYRGNPRRRKRKPMARNTKAVKKEKPGQKLGGDLEIRKLLDGGKSKAAPRVVKSKRGQELRASAAEMRFSAQLTGQSEGSGEDVDEYEESLDNKVKWKVEDEDKVTQDLLKDELKTELTSLRQSRLEFPVVSTPALARVKSEMQESVIGSSAAAPTTFDLTNTDDSLTEDEDDRVPIDNRNVDGEANHIDGKRCVICTFSSPPGARTCEGCGTQIYKTSNTWQCLLPECNAEFLNHVDSAICGLCGQKRGTNQGHLQHAGS